MGFVPRVNHIVGASNWYGGRPGIVTVNFTPTSPIYADLVKGLADGTLIVQYGEPDTNDNCAQVCSVALWIKTCSECDTGYVSLLTGATTTYTANGAITVDNESTITITKTGALAAMTLAAPTDDQLGRTVTIMSLSGFAHTVTQTTPGFNNAGASADVATFSTTVGSSMTIQAVQTTGGTNFWAVLNLNGVTLA